MHALTSITCLQVINQEEPPSQNDISEHSDYENDPMWDAYAYPNKGDYNVESTSTCNSPASCSQETKNVKSFEDLLEDNKYYENENKELTEIVNQLKQENRKLLDENISLKDIIHDLEYEAGFNLPK